MTVETKQRIYELVKVVCGTTTMTPEEEELKEQGYDQMEDFLGNIPVDSDDDGGFYLLRDMWEIKSGKIVA